MRRGGAPAASGPCRGAVWALQCACWVLWTALALAASPAAAQALRLIGADGPPVTLLPAPADDPAVGACLQVEDGLLPRPVMPVALRPQRFDAVVRVELRFTRPNRPPTARVLHAQAPDNASRLLAESVLEHARHLRLPCLPRDAEGATLVRDYRFNMAGEYELPLLRDRQNDPRSREAQACLTHVSGAKTPAAPLERLPGEGRVVVRARFTSPDQAPEVQAHHFPPAAPARDFALQWMSGFRVPCLQGEPVELTFALQFQYVDQVLGFRDLSLTQLLRQARRRPDAQTWDTHSMGCPFDLVLWYGQPHLPNIVMGLVTRHEGRAPFFERLVGLELDLLPSQLNAVYGSQVDVHVPCGRFVH